MFTTFISSIADVNECLKVDHGCHMNASCVNLNGTYTCKCKQGFVGNGTSCDGM